MKRQSSGLKSKPTSWFGLTEFIAGPITIVLEQGLISSTVTNWAVRLIISRDEISVHYHQGRCQIDPVLTSNASTTLKDVWRKAIEQPGVLVLVKHQKTNILELDVHVDYPPKRLGDEDEEFGQVCSITIVLYSSIINYSLLYKNFEHTMSAACSTRARKRHIEDQDTEAIPPYKRHMWSDN